MFLFAATGRAGELFEYQRPISALGTGGVYLPWVEDTDAPMWNPALLNEVNELSWKVADITFGANGKDLFDTYTAVSNSGCSGTACYSQYYGKPIRATYFGDTSLTMPHWGFTGFMGGRVEGILHNPAFPTMNMTYLSDYGFVSGFGFGLLPGVSGGVSLKRISRRGGDQELSLSTLTSASASFLDDFDQRGTGYGFDLALMWRTPEQVPLRLSAVADWQDVGSTAFLVDPAAQVAPDRIQDNLSVGFGAVMDLPGLDWKAGMEYRHINLQGEQLGKKLHFGTELGLPLVDLRAGLNQGYPTIGLGMDLFFMRFDLASYTEELGVYPGQTPSQRVDATLSFSLSVDANFKFTTKDGKHRKLKQRR